MYFFANEAGSTLGWFEGRCPWGDESAFRLAELLLEGSPELAERALDDVDTLGWEFPFGTTIEPWEFR